MKSFSSLFQFTKRERRQKRRGVVTVEVALCLVFVLLPVTLGGFQFAFFFMTQHSLQQVARESARYASVHFNDDEFDLNENQGNVPKSQRSLKNVIRRQAAANGIGWEDINGTLLPGNLRGGYVVTPASERVKGQPFTITITYPMKKRALLGSLFFRGPDGKIDPMRLGFFDDNYSVTSTTLME